tara:strand:+ start:2968 stop:6447 length:3480 start_codon:yes stop_codon:yes gene_type:complete
LIRRASKIALEVVGVAVAATAVLLAVLAWRLSSGPVSLPILSQIMEDAVAGDLDGGRLEIGDTILRWDAARRQIGMRVVNVIVTGADGNRVTALPEIAFRLSVPALLRGQIAPTSVELYGIKTTLLRRATGLSFGLAAADAPIDETESSLVIGPMIDALVNGSAEVPLLAYLRRFAIYDATLSVVDEINGVTFEAPNANLTLLRGDGGLAATLSADMMLADTTGHIELEGALPQGADMATVKMQVSNIVPAALARMSPAFHNYGIGDAPLSATGNLDIKRDGTLVGARLEVEAGKGRFTIPGLAQAPVDLVKARAALTLDARAQHVAISDLTLQAGPHSIDMTGTADYVLGEGVDLTSVAFDLKAGKTTTEIPGFFEGPVTFDDIHLIGTLDLVNRNIDVKEAVLVVAGGKITASGIVGEGARSPALKARATIGTIPLDEARAVWPIPLSHKSREWVVKNLKDGELVGAEFSIDVPADMLADNEEKHIPIPDGGLVFDFNVRGVTAQYLHGMPPLTNVVARGLVGNNRFDAWVSSGQVTVAPDQVLNVTKGHFADTSLSTKGTIGEIEFMATGKTAHILALIDHEPLNLLHKFGMDPQTIGGEGIVNAALRLPLLKDVTMDQIDFFGTAHAENVSIPDIQPNLSITSGTLDIDIKRSGLVAKGVVGLNGTPPLDIVWSESFVKGSKAGTSYHLTGSLDNAARNAIGLKFDKFVDGPSIIDATLTGSGSKIDAAKIHADLTGATVMLDYLGWVKPVGQAVEGSVDLAFNDNSYDFSNFKLTGAGTQAGGEFVMNKSWDWMSLNFPSVQLGPNNNLAIRGRRDDKGTLTIDVNGPKADASGLLHNFVSGNGDKADAELAATRLLTSDMVADPALRTVVRAAVGDVAGQNGTRFSNIDAHFAMVDGDVYTMSIDGMDATGKPLKASITPAAGRTRDFAMSSDDAGNVFLALDLFKGVKGGALKAKAVIDDNLPGSPMKGDIDVTKFRIANAPVLAKILTLGSLTGISDTMAGEGIYFDHLTLPFRVTGHRIHVEEARVAGPAIGLTMGGQIDRTADVVDLEGTLVPAYTINSVLGNVPLVGPLIIGREGEGIFGFTYAVKGAIDNPSVYVNPLSAIAPGFLRRLFEFGSSLPPEATAAPQQKTPAPLEKAPDSAPESAAPAP